MINLKDIYVGDVDAKNELLIMNGDAIHRFSESFTIPDGVLIDEFLNGRLFFVTGLKGTGKTALLRYLSIRAGDSGVSNKFVLFKSDIKEKDRKKLKDHSNTIIVEEGGSKKYLNDFENVWMLFLHKIIVNHIKSECLDVFKEDQNWIKYKYAVSGADYGNRALGVLQYFPIIKNGLIELIVPDDYKQHFKGDIQSADGEKVNFSDLVSYINDIFSKLVPNEKRIFIFIDEVELSLGSPEQYKRDINLIRDLIVSVESLNRIMASKNFPIKICCAVRKEVITAVESVGKEIAKPTEDFGVEIIWNSRIGNINESFDHPLIKLVAKKIYISEKFKNINREKFDVKEIFSDYFPEQINGIAITEYLLNNSWFRPRDFSRMLRPITKQFGENLYGFQQSFFEHTKKNYSTSSWTEIAEELSAKYDKGTIKAIENLFSNIDSHFNFDKLEKQINKKKKYIQSLCPYENPQKLTDLLNDLFSVGFLGNSNPFRAHFRGDPSLNIEGTMMVHRALWSHFSII